MLGAGNAFPELVDRRFFFCGWHLLVRLSIKNAPTDVRAQDAKQGPRP
jgi:hypothetical protein